MSDPALEAVAAHALELVSDGAKLGLGTGRAATAFIAALGARVRAGLRVVGVPTSAESAHAARHAGIPLIELGEDVLLDLTVDGADEVAPNLDLVKGWGGALVAEQIAAAASKRQVILVGHEKLVRTLGERGRIPVEVIPLACGLVTRAMRALELTPTLRLDPQTHRPSVSANGNLTLDCALRAPLLDRASARTLESALRALHGVVDTGLFLGTAERVLVGHPDGRVEVLHAAPAKR
ncbi:MAG: ribose-5-phosphate isomerase RpiA [Solirubrobacteraceae bacterium]